MDKEIFLSLCGCFGRMGKCIIDEIENFQEISISCGVDRSNRKSELFPVVDCANKIYTKSDVILDFSHPSALDSLLEFSIKKFIPLVICTTGYSDEQMEKIKKSSEKIPIFFSSNTSLGINVMINISKIAKSILGSEFDIEIIEKHHNKKIDAPSGTALMIAEAISDDSSKYIFDRSSLKRKREKNEIGISSVRCGGIMGEHEIIFASENEILSLKHSISSRRVLARGALEAVRFIINQDPGLYSMEDLINWRINERSIHV